MLFLLWDSGPNLFHFHWNVPFWPIVIVLFAVWWITGGKHRMQDDETDETASDAAGHESSHADPDSDTGSDEEDEESANKA